MSWFYNTFLPSLFERAGCNNAIWLTQKQTAVCVEHMEKHVVRTDELQGYYRTSYWFSATWNGRPVRLIYSKRNGCGTITFGFTMEEAEESNRRYAEEKRQEAAERMERKREWAAWARENAPDKLAQRVARFQARIQAKRKELEEVREDIAEVDNQWRGADIAYAAELEKELADAEAILAIYL